METHWLKRAGEARLAVFVLGWAADWQIVEKAVPRGCDALAVYDFRKLEPLVIPSYSDVYLFAWSFGVRVAEEILGDIKPARAVALNGTPRPVDERFGIAPRRMAATLRGLAAGGMEAFEHRAYGEYYDGLRDVLSPRGLAANILELNELCALAERSPKFDVAWYKAIVGSRDEIFTPENQLAFWGSRAELLPLPHYPFADAELIEREIENR
jgi:hypothetical protein